MWAVKIETGEWYRVVTVKNTEEYIEVPTSSDITIWSLTTGMLQLSLLNSLAVVAALEVTKNHLSQRLMFTSDSPFTLFVCGYSTRSDVLSFTRFICY